MTKRQFARRIDANQGEIVEALRGAGASVLLLHTVGRGCPDALVGFRNVNFLIEIKISEGKLTDDERQFFDTWRGQVTVVRTVEDALRLLEETEE